MRSGLFRRGLVFGIIILFIGATIVPSTGHIIKKTSSTISKSPGYIQDLCCLY